MYVLIKVAQNSDKTCINAANRRKVSLLKKWLQCSQQILVLTEI